MITQLNIKNYALIEDIKVNFNEGLTIITGETGAGKSIILGALSLLLGKRADLSSIKNTTKKCIIEAEFNLEKHALEPLFVSENLDYEKNTIIRREILPSGKSRAFVNDTPVNLSILSLLGNHLIDIHNQHQTLEISSEKFQMEIIDVLAKNKSTLNEYSKTLKHYKNTEKELNSLLTSKIEAQKELDYNLFLIRELQDARLKKGSQEAMEEELETLSNVETIQETLSEVSQLMNAENVGVLTVLSEINSKMSKIKGFSNTYQALWERLQSTKIELDDVSDEVQNAGDLLEANPQRLMEVETYLQSVYKLQSKHQVNTIESLLEIQSQLELKIEKTNNLDQSIVTFERELKSCEIELKDQAEKLHKNREKTLPILIEKLENILAQLGLPNARFRIDLEKTTSFQKNGIDDVIFQFTANKGMPFGEMKKVASGGELSRIMLAIKSVLAQYTQLPAIIFDEIDTGVSGEIANKIADILAKMSKSMQVISITHLPQIAAKGDHHFKVYKEDDEKQTQTKLQLLNPENRILEIAEMLSGDKKSESAIAHARELLN
ncbi:DNA repair protein RecN [uncultured Planktosalinus sp.]|uniref:DNA repair protein RecN n=1 Tax=uncultured Planktosalinus sp. TaxID=1810935 RepID=UPI0030D8F089